MSTSSKDTEKMAALGRMTRGLVHDFNNSLASIMGYAEFLVSDLEKNSEQHLFASSIKKAGLQMQELIDQIRAFSHEKGQGKDIPLNLVTETKLIAERFEEFLAPHQSIIISSDIEEAVLSISPHQARTLLSNLVRNAVEALGTEGGEISIHISQTPSADVETPPYQFKTTLLTAADTGSSLLRIDVTDTGHGMDNDTINQAAIPQFTTKIGGDARGIGLSIVCGILGYLGGGLALSSTPQKGTTVSVILPVEHISIADQKPISAEIPVRNILLVEDRDMLRHTIETMLTREHHHVHACPDGFSALDELRENPDKYDILITDYTMPELNGKDLIDEVRTDFPFLPIIVISGDTDHLKTIRNNFEGLNISVLPKPLSALDLKTTIRNIRGQKKQ